MIQPLPADATHLALRQSLASLELAQACGRPWALAEACRETGRCYAALGLLPAALEMLAQALRWARLTGSGDQAVDLLCEAVELLAEQSEQAEREQAGSGRRARERARDAVFEASQWAARVADPRWEVTVLLRLSDVLDRFGDRDDATLLQMRALQLTVGHRPEPPHPELADASARRRH